MRQLSYIGTTIFLSAVAAVAGCTAEIVGGNETTGSGGAGAGAGNGSGATPGTGGTAGTAGTAGTGGSGGDPSVCIPGIPGTSQIPRLLNREYDAVVRDLLNVTALASAGNAAPSSLLVPDFEGSLTDIAWNSYLVAAARIAEEVMGGANRSLFMACNPADAGCFESTIRGFGRKAFRRPVSNEEVTSFMRLATLQPQGTPDEIAEAILFAFLSSPSFIMVPELAQDQLEGTAIKLNSHEVATRLSFLLWGSVPDDTLNTAADAGQLTTKEQILAQAQRMILDRGKTAPAVTNFHRTYADIREGSHWGTLDHDTTKYPSYSPAAVAPMMAEMDAFFEDVAFGGGTFKDLFLSRVGFVNRDTAPLYGLEPANFGTELTRVDLDPNERPGFLTRVGFLSSFSAYATTSPILRGAFVMTRVLGVPLQPTPGVEDTPIPPGTYTTQRQAIEALTSPTGCADCHNTYVNPPGFVLERYDAVGKVQTTDPLGGAIDGTGNVYLGENNTKTITTPYELMNELGLGAIAQRHYAERWVSYALGRSPNSNDACVVDQLGLKLSTDGYTILNLLTDITQADSFRLRVVGN